MKKLGLKKKNLKISQEEVDGIVKHEVNKQLRMLRKRRDPRLGRIKKVVALEKMRRLLKRLDYDEDDDIDY